MTRRFAQFTCLAALQLVVGCVASPVTYLDLANRENQVAVSPRTMNPDVELGQPYPVYQRQPTKPVPRQLLEPDSIGSDTSDSNEPDGLLARASTRHARDRDLEFDPMIESWGAGRTTTPISTFPEFEWATGLDDRHLWTDNEIPGLTFGGLFQEQAHGIVADFKNFYSPESLIGLAGGFAAGAIMANSSFDEHVLRDTYLDNIVFAPNDDLYEKLHEPKFLGDGIYTIPAFLVAAVAQPVIEDLPLGRQTSQWGQRSLRTILVGGPPMLGMQLITGGSRPGETSSESKWKLLQDNNGVSGHSFMGAIPFMSAAKMTDDIWLKSGLYLASAMPAVSRVNDDAHYFSQAFLGWWMAYVAATAVDWSHQSLAMKKWRVEPYPAGLMIVREW